MPRVVLSSLLASLLGACGPSYWDELEERQEAAENEEDLLGQDEADEGVWVPPDEREVDGGTTDVPLDPEKEAEDFDSFIDAYEDLYCVLLDECGYGISESQCRNYFADYWKDECEDYPEEWGAACLTAMLEGGCEALADGTASIECQPVRDECSASSPD